MSGLIEPKPTLNDPISPIASGFDQATGLRAMFGRTSEPFGASNHARNRRSSDGAAIRIAWLADESLSLTRAEVANLAAMVVQNEGVPISFDSDASRPAPLMCGLLLICDSCEGASRALKRIRHAIADNAMSTARTEAAAGWIGMLGLAHDAVQERIVSASLRGVGQTVGQLMGEPVEQLGTVRLARLRNQWSAGRSGRGLSDESIQRIQKFLISRARTACAIR